MKRRFPSNPILAGTVAIGLAWGCASTRESKELLAARALYADAQRSAAATVEPDQLLTAKQALERAEAAHIEEPGGAAERHLAYIAQRKASYAIAAANETNAHSQREAAEARFVKLSEEKRKNAQEALLATESQLSVKEAELAKERQARSQAETELRTALESLKEIALVKAEQQDLVITLDGAVLFAPGKSELMPIAKEKLRTVAKALKAQGSRKQLIVKGHTDDVGADDFNQRLSQARADAVRVFLISEGIESGRIVAIGKGESEPVAENTTPEGRANNRRVEIVIRDDDDTT